MINIEQLTNSVGRLVNEIEKLDSHQIEQQKARRAPVRKKVVLKNGKVVKVTRVPSTKVVYNLLKKFDHGLDISQLMDETGYDQQKIYNITHRLKNEGKIKNVERGVYRVVQEARYVELGTAFK